MDNDTGNLKIRDNDLIEFCIPDIQMINKIKWEQYEVENDLVLALFITLQKIMTYLLKFHSNQNLKDKF
jgi:hypothetical protein